MYGEKRRACGYYGPGGGTEYGFEEPSVYISSSRHGYIEQCGTDTTTPTPYKMCKCSSH